MTGSSLVRRTILVAIATTAIASTAAAQTIVVPTFQAGSAVFSQHLQDVDVAPAPGGSFIIIWGDYSLTTLSGAKDFATVQRFGSDGSALAPANRADTSAHVFSPVIHADPRGGFVAAWEWINGNAHQYRFFGQRLNGNGLPAGNDFEVTLNTVGLVHGGDVVGTVDGPVFFWEQKGFWARTLDDNLDRLGGDILVGQSAYTSEAEVLSDGGIIVTWRGGFNESASMGRRFGGPQAPHESFAVSDLFSTPHVGTNPLGGFAVVGSRWTGTESEVRARRYGADGAPIGDEFVVHTVPGSIYLYTDIAYDQLGNLYVVWTEYDTQLGAQPPRARAYDRDGLPLGPAVTISDQPGVEIKVVRLANGTFANVWYWRGKAWATITALCAGGGACGDGVYDAACEQCDSGAGNSDSAPDACRTNCRTAACGDGVIDSNETCDDGNRTSCDGCSADCALEPGFACGDGVRSRACGEECDDGVGNSDALPDACRTNCHPAVCGDGVVDSGEECDDGNRVPCDGCSMQCVLEANMPDANGNGVADACDDCAEFLTRLETSATGCAPPVLSTATAAEQSRFADGRQEFEEIEHPSSGLGPVFNHTACSHCHAFPTAGGSSAESVTRIGATVDGQFSPLEEYGGSLLQADGIVTASCSVGGETVPPEATFVSHRNTPALYGAGLIEAIDEFRIRKMSDPTDKNHDGISGRYHYIGGRVGRFGWKAQFVTLHDFGAAAYVDEMGITTPFLPNENAPQGGPIVCDDEPDPEDDGSSVGRFADFMEMLAPPTAVTKSSREARRGRGVFRRLKCHKCHTDRYRTRQFAVAALSNKRVRLYSDLLLHDMGPALDDGVPQGLAGSREWRTPPLWGVRFSAPYLHDGRAATLHEAIAAHDGEAAQARNAYMVQSPERKAALIAFLESL